MNISDLILEKLGNTKAATLVLTKAMAVLNAATSQSMAAHRGNKNEMARCNEVIILKMQAVEAMLDVMVALGETSEKVCHEITSEVMKTANEIKRS